MEEKKVEVVMFVGLPESGQKELFDRIYADTHHMIDGEDAKERMLASLADGKSCVVNGVPLVAADRSEIVNAARNAGARVVCVLFKVEPSRFPEIRFRQGRTIPIEYHIPDCIAPFDFPNLEEGFDTILVAKFTDGEIRCRMFEERVPMCEWVKGPDGKPVSKPLPPEFYMIERPHATGCLISRAAFDRLMTKNKRTCR